MLPTREINVEALIFQILGQIELNPTREGLRETPRRVQKAFRHWFGGYFMNAEDVLKTFEDGAPVNQQEITVQDIPFWSHCEHHMAPFFGTVSISYTPTTKIVGLSKMIRLVQVFAHRLQVQERLTDQIASAIMQHLAPKNVTVKIQARHSCMESRGVTTNGSSTVTSVFLGEK